MYWLYEASIGSNSFGYVGNQVLLVLSQKVMEFSIRVYVEWLVPNQLRQSHLQTQAEQHNPSTTQTQALQTPFRTLAPGQSHIHSSFAIPFKKPSHTWAQSLSCLGQDSRQSQAH